MVPQFSPLSELKRFNCALDQSDQEIHTLENPRKRRLSDHSLIKVEEFIKDHFSNLWQTEDIKLIKEISSLFSKIERCPESLEKERVLNRIAEILHRIDKHLFLFEAEGNLNQIEAEIPAGYFPTIKRDSKGRIEDPVGQITSLAKLLIEPLSPKGERFLFRRSLQ